MSRRCRSAAGVAECAPLHAKEAMELFAQEVENGRAVHGSSRWGRLGELWLRAACWALMVGDARGAGAMEACGHGAEEGVPVCGVSRCASGPLRGALRGGEVRVQACGARLGGHRAKCLQTCVLDAMVGARRERIARALARSCGNGDGAGYAGTVREARNLDATRRVLAAERV